MAENAIRPYVVGWKNGLFSGQPNRAQDGATFFSLIETAKANGSEPFAYLRYLNKHLPFDKKQSGYRNPLPKSVTPEIIGCSAEN